MAHLRHAMAATSAFGEDSPSTTMELSQIRDEHETRLIAFLSLLYLVPKEGQGMKTADNRNDRNSNN